MLEAQVPFAEEGKGHQRGLPGRRDTVDVFSIISSDQSGVGEGTFQEEGTTFAKARRREAGCWGTASSSSVCMEDRE